MSPSAPATLGGAGWRPRGTTHAEDVGAGSLWRRCGLRSEVGQIVEVTLSLPDERFGVTGAANDFLFLEWPDPGALRRQALAIGAYYEALGVTVTWTGAMPSAPNYLFQRDLYFMTPDGAVLSRPGSEQRAGEARVMAGALAGLGVPILGTPTGDATFEGADALWLDQGQVLLGVGHRTNRSGASYLAHLLEPFGVEVISIELPRGLQHLLGLLNFIDCDLAAVRNGLVPQSLASRLEDCGIRTVPCDPGVDLTDRFGMNFVTLSPRHVVMPAGHPEVKRKLSAAGVRVEEIEIGEYLKAAGGLGCLTGILCREEP